MEKATGRDDVRTTVLRMLLVLIVTAGFGLVFFQRAVFEMRTMASQFLTSGVTCGISYAAWRSARWRDGLAALFVWFLVRAFLITEYNWWLLVLSFGYVAGISAGVFLFVRFAREGIVRGIVQRVAGAGVITAIANALIMVFLGLWSWHAVKTSPGFFASVVFRNLQFGTLIGIGMGLGAEASEYVLIRLKWESPGDAWPGSVPAGVHHESTEMHGETIVVNCAKCGQEIELSPAEVAAEAYACPSCGTPGTL